MTFELQYTDPKSNARAGLITTDHGQIETPIFMPVGTLGTVKGVHLHEIKDDIQAQIILGNTYHLYLRPGLDVIEKAGGLHKFNGFDRPMLTDSGGFQVFSLSGIRKMREEGVEFRSHIDGSKHLFTPERVMDIERTIGADIMMAFDECTPGTADFQYAKKSMELTHRWLDRCLKRFNETEPKYGYHQSLFPIVQGCVYPDLRRKSAEFIASKGAEGNAIGGLAVGEPAEKMYEMIEVVNEILPKDKPRYLMGVGTPLDILGAVERGVDMFDCVLPTRIARNGTAMTWNGKVVVRNAAYEIIRGRGATWDGIAAAVADLLRCIINDERRILTVSTVSGIGASALAMSLPRIVGRGGVITTLMPKMTAPESAALRRSGKIIRRNFDAIAK